MLPGSIEITYSGDDIDDTYKSSEVNYLVHIKNLIIDSTAVNNCGIIANTNELKD